MEAIKGTRVAYIVKRYPRYSETFIVNEILAHEAAGMELQILSLYPPCDTHFQDIISQVRASVHYFTAGNVKTTHFWDAMQEVGKDLPLFWDAFREMPQEDAATVYRAVCIARHVVENRISHLHAHFGSVATSVARLVSRFTGIPFSFTAHAKDIFHESVDPTDLRLKLAQASRVITVSDYNLSYLRSTFTEDAARVVRVYNGLDLQKFAYSPQLERPRRIVAVGRLVEKKGFSVLIAACDLLSKQGIPYECIIVGSGEEESRLRQQIRMANLQGQVQLLGPRPQSEIAGLVQSAAIFAAPCIVGDDGNRDGLPTVLLEAMALGTPCISTNVTGIPEVIIDGVTGLQVDQNDATALAAGLKMLLDDSHLQGRLAAAARELLEQEFDIHKNARKMREQLHLLREEAPVLSGEVQ